MKALLLGLASVLVTPGLSFPATINVPADYTTIQAAINAASTGDTILVAPGSYLENINFTGKDITVRSTGGPAVTTIDGNQAGPVVRFASGEWRDAILDGFTITNGNGGGNGGGIQIHESSPTVSNNIITGNTSNTGGGIKIQTGVNPSFSAWPLIVGNTISLNTATNGAAIACLGSDYKAYATLSRNLIQQNQGNGPFIWCWKNCEISSDNNIISNNTVLMAAAGGIIVNGCIWVSENDTIAANTVPKSALPDTGNGVHVAWMYPYFPGRVELYNTILWNNGDAFELYITGNSTYPAQAVVGHSDVQGGQAGVYAWAPIALHWLAGNIQAAPKFQNNFHLQIVSPCIDAGFNDYVSYGALDIDGDPRIVDGNGNNQSIADIGADEYLTRLGVDTNSVSVSQGGTVNFFLNAGLVNSGRTYAILGSVSGTSPGLPLPGGYATLPINWDNFTNIVVTRLNSPTFKDFLRQLDTNGKSTAQLNAPPVPGALGVSMYYAYALDNPMNFVSNPVTITFVP